jgi:ATP-dependent Lhr-like helicase
MNSEKALGQHFHPLVWTWFQNRFGAPTPAQERGWPVLLRRENTLIAAPTGGGKTLSAFFVAINELITQAIEGRLDEGTQVLYLSPLRALSNDIKKNLEEPLAEISELLRAHGYRFPGITVGLRTGDSTPGERARLIKRPPHILVTTPESLFLMLTSAKARPTLASVKTLIVDEIHALARDKRGTHMSLSLEQLHRLPKVPPLRIGLSATQKPLDGIARFLVGGLPGERSCTIVDVSQQREADIGILTPSLALSSICSTEQWEDIYGQLQALITAHRSTLIFVNTRYMAERISFQLSEALGEHAVACHHGSLSKAKRLEAEDLLKNGKIKAIVATASLELGIDIGTIDLVCQISSPRSIAGFVQRVGRSGHALGLKPKARLIALTRDELIECLALVRSYREGLVDTIEIPKQPIDILAQHIVSLVASEDRSPDGVFEILRRAHPYEHLSFATLEKILGWLSEGLAENTRRGSYLHWDKVNNTLRARRNARLAVVTSGGAIPEQNLYRVMQESDMSVVGTVDEEFAVESGRGDIFLLGNHSWQISGLKGDVLLVKDLHGAPPTIPFWKGEAGGRTFELSHEISRLRAEADVMLSSLPEPVIEGSAEDKATAWRTFTAGLADWLMDEFGCAPRDAQQAAEFFAAQKIALGHIPHQSRIVYERFFDETGGMQLIVHAPFGSRVNRAWGLAFRKRFCRGFDFELQASATDNGILLSVGPNQSFPLEAMFKMLNPSNCRSLLIQALLDVPMFEVRWRWNATRALAVLRTKAGKRVPPHLQRYRSNDLLTAVFPQQTQCFEHRTGDLEIPDHPLVQQTVYDCLQEAMDADRFEGIMKAIDQGSIELTARDTREPSPFCYELIHANPYAFLDDAPLEERRVRAMSTRYTLDPEIFQDLSALAPEAVSAVVSEAWPLIRDRDELFDAMKQMLLMRGEWLVSYQDHLKHLIKERRVGELVIADHRYYFPRERELLVHALYPSAFATDKSCLETHDKALSSLLRGHLECRGPLTALRLAKEFALDEGLIGAVLASLESQGLILRGHFNGPGEWCERRLAQRMHRLTIEGLREKIKPASPSDFLRYLQRHTHAFSETRLEGQKGLEEVIEQMQGLEAASAAWESEIFQSRIKHYRGSDLDQLGQSGRIAWARFSPMKSDRPSKNRLFSRNTPLAFAKRAALAWLLPRNRSCAKDALSPIAAHLWSILETRGALFFDEIAAAAKLLPTQAEDALSELIAMGFVQSDSFASLRPLISPDRKPRQPARSARSMRFTSDFRSGGRFAPFARDIVVPQDDARLEDWAWLLLKRYGVVFRDLLHREHLAPSWGELVPMYRTLEARGTIRGGRFIEKVGGEQFALMDAVDELRRVRALPKDQELLILSAFDPLNQMGILSPEPKLAQKPGNRLAFRDGRYLACRSSGEITFLDETLNAADRARIDRALRLNGLFRALDPFVHDPVSSPTRPSLGEPKVNLLKNWRSYRLEPASPQS